MHWTCLALWWCNVVSICVAISFESTVLATNNLSSITALPASASRSCGGCNIDERVFQFDWFSEIFTHTAATVVKIVNNSTNVTRTSTILASDFVLPSTVFGAAQRVSEVVLTTEIGGVNYTLTWPTKYIGIGGIASYTQFLVTDSGGNVKCVSSSAYITRDFLLGQYASIDKLRATVEEKAAKQGCEVFQASPPMVLVPVLSLTQTETNYDQSPARKTSAARKAAPSKPIIAPTVTPTSSPEANLRETPPTLPKSPIVESRPTKPNTPPRTTSNVESLSPSNLESPSLDQGSAFDKDLPPFSPAAGSEVQPSRINGQVTKASTDTSNIKPGTNRPESNTPNSPDNTPASISSDGGNEEPSRDFSTDRLTFGGQVEARPTPSPQLVLPVGSSVISANLDGDFIITDQTLVPDESPVTVLRKSIYLQPSKAAAVIDDGIVSVQQAPRESIDSAPLIVLPSGFNRIAANLENNFVIESQTLIPGGSPITALGKSIYLQPSNAAAVIDGSTVALQQAPLESSYSAPPIVLAIGSSRIAANSEGNFVIGSQTLIPGGSPITALGKSIYLQPSNAAAVIDGSTVTLQQAPLELTYSNPPIVLPIGDSRIAANSEGNFVIGSQTLIPGGSPVTALGKSIYLQPSGSAAVIDGSTVTLQQASLELTYSNPPIVLPIGSSRIAANSEGNFVIGSQTLFPGGSPVTALGKSIYLQPSGSAAVIDGNTVALDQAPPTLAFGTETFEQEKSGGYIIGSQTLIAGGAPITVAGTPVSLAPSASALIFGATTIVYKADPGALVFDNQVLVPDRTGGYILGSQTLFPGRAPITIEGTPLSLAPLASALIIGSKTLTPRPAPSFPTVVIHQATVQVNTASEFLIDGQTLVAGAPPISIDGQPVSLAPGESQVVIGSSTKTLSSADSGPASLILQGFGKIGSDATSTTSKSNTTSPTLAAQYTGSAGLGKRTTGTTWIGLTLVFMGYAIHKQSR